MNPAARLIIQRLLLGVLTLLVVSMLIFAAVEFLPGDLAEATLGQEATEETVAAIRRKLGLDRPPVERYFVWLGNLFQGELGVSYANGRDIVEVMGTRAQNTLFLAGMVAIIATPLAVGLGIIAALYRNSYLDRFINLVSLSAISIPEFLIAYLLIVTLSRSGMFPSFVVIDETTSLISRIYQSILPALALTVVVSAHMMRMTRASIINVLASAYVEMAHIKGAPKPAVVVRHALPNALAPIINVIAINLAWLVVGVVVVEVIFVYPGLGQLMVDSVGKRDIPVVQACSLFFASVYIILNLLADIGATLSNPRLRHGR
ncbi:ABC transporter permease [Roseovarius sp. ZX-A-9]|uniref:ABC transporter permease n=1 Tax=Roseovarius sp. ZX-A-9 TaxID=3014783 RepID=UPI00232D4C96|nr:ABC transporter permease [Roseovarius sp. ZX-A-9]